MKLLLILFLTSLITISITMCGPCNSKRNKEYTALTTETTKPKTATVISKNGEFIIMVKAQSIDNYQLGIGIDLTTIIKEDLSNAEMEDIFRETFEQAWQKILVKTAPDMEQKQLEIKKEKCYQSWKELYNENLLSATKKLTALSNERVHEDEQ